MPGVPIYGAAVSYDFFPFYQRGSGGFAVTPALEARYVPGGDHSATYVGATLAFGYWLGLEKKELELPVDEAFAR